MTWKIGQTGNGKWYAVRANPVWLKQCESGQDSALCSDLYLSFDGTWREAGEWFNPEDFCKVFIASVNLMKEQDISELNVTFLPVSDRDRMASRLAHALSHDQQFRLEL